MAAAGEGALAAGIDSMNLGRGAGFGWTGEVRRPRCRKGKATQVLPSVISFPATLPGACCGDLAPPEDQTRRRPP
jgi:hypothetical protein